jgi:hypothetical protein
MPIVREMRQRMRGPSWKSIVLLYAAVPEGTTRPAVIEAWAALSITDKLVEALLLNPVCTENLNTDVVMMKSAEYRV